MDAAWGLCTRGILHPYTKEIGAQGSTNPGFSLTAFGRKWLNESDLDDYVPTSPGRFSEMLLPFSEIFGSAFQERAQEAVNSYTAHNYLACCVMSGSAAETIIIKVADKLSIKYSEREHISKMRDKIISSSGKGVKEPLIAYSDIVKYWRDSGMHHNQFNITSNEAFVSLSLLLRLAMFADEQWFKIICKKQDMA